MSTLKIFLRVKNTLKTIIQKNSSKSQKFATKLSVAEFPELDFRYTKRETSKK